jgi:hypothetical protein
MNKSSLGLVIDSIINPINVNFKELVIYKGFERYESGWLNKNDNNKKNLVRWSSLEEKSFLAQQEGSIQEKDALAKINLDYEPISLL